jgi:hypothetical protein
VPLTEIQRADVLLQPTKALGEHFMKLVQPDDCLQAIATACRETEVLAGESREALETMLMADRFSDLDQMNSCLRYGPAALDRFIRLNLDGRTLDLPCSYLPEKLGRSPQEMRLIDTGYAPLNEQGKALLYELSPYDTVATVDMACVMMQMPGIVAPAREVIESARRLVPQPPMQPLTLYCPLTLCVEDGDDCDLVETDPHISAWFEGEISAALRNEISDGENMADYLPTEWKDKIASVEFDVARFGELLYGKISNVCLKLWKFTSLSPAAARYRLNRYPYIAYGKITVIQGDPGDGKTTLVLNIAALAGSRGGLRKDRLHRRHGTAADARRQPPGNRHSNMRGKAAGAGPHSGFHRRGRGHGPRPRNAAAAEPSGQYRRAHRLRRGDHRVHEQGRRRERAVSRPGFH